jgi:hypothetical protein
MALAIDSQMPSATGQFTEGGTGGTPPGPLTFSFTNTAGTYMLVSVAWGKRGSLTGSYTIASVTYGGQSMSQEIAVQTDSNHDGVAFYSLLSPPTGANDIVVTATTAGQFDANSTIIAGAITFTGQHATPLVAAQTASAAQEAETTSTSLATPNATTTGNYAVWAHACGAGITSVNQTESYRRNVNTNSTAGNASMQYAAGTGSAITGTFNHGNDWAQTVVVEVAAASGTAIPVTQGTQTLTGLAAGLGFTIPVPADLT